MLYVDIRTTNISDVVNTQLILGYSRKPTAFNSKRKAVVGAIIALACFVSYVMLAAPDVPDTKPTAAITWGER